MKIKNDSSAIAAMNDISGSQTGQGLVLQPGEEKLLFDEQAEQSAQLQALIDNGTIVIMSTEEPLDSGPSADIDLSLKADKVAAVAAANAGSISTADSAVTAAADAATQTGLYVQADVQSIADLANDLKTQYNAAVTLLNEAKSDYNAAVTLINELKTKLNSMND